MIVWVVGVWGVGVLVNRYKMSGLSSHQILWNTLPLSLVSNSYVPHFSMDAYYTLVLLFMLHIFGINFHRKKNSDCGIKLNLHHSFYSFLHTLTAKPLLPGPRPSPHPNHLCGAVLHLRGITGVED